MRREEARRGEQGFMLLAMIVAIFLVLLVLGIAAPKVAQDLRRDREVEAIHRGNEYVRAIRLYYKKFGHYPASMDMLEKSNNIRFLRQRYVNPLTGKADWRMIKVGEAKTTVKGFFGQPLAGMPGSAGGLGSAAGMSSNIGGAGSAGGAAPAGSSGSAFSSSSSSGYGSSPGSGLGGSGGLGGTSLGGGSSPTSGIGSGGLGGSSSPGSGLGSSPGGASGTPGAAGSSGTESMGGGMTSQSASTFTGGGAPFVGVGIVKSGDSITVLNEQTTYQTWEFIYDPRIEQQAAAAALMGGGGANNSSGFGSSGTGFGSGSGFGTTPGLNGTPNSPGGVTNPSSPGGLGGPTSPTGPQGGTNPGSSGPQ